MNDLLEECLFVFIFDIRLYLSSIPYSSSESDETINKAKQKKKTTTKTETSDEGERMAAYIHTWKHDSIHIFLAASK